jgi:hypothetical protein
MLQVTIQPEVAGKSLAVDDLAPGNGPEQADSGAAARFSELLEAPTDAASEESAVDEVAGPSAPTSPATVGDQIIGAMKNASVDMQKGWAQIGGILDRPSSQIGLNEIMKAQMQLVRITFDAEIWSKGISRATQNIESLEKMQ